jgi:hypothetical protein
VPNPIVRKRIQIERHFSLAVPPPAPAHYGVDGWWVPPGGYDGHDVSPAPPPGENSNRGQGGK